MSIDFTIGNFRAALFDLDGVVVFTDKYHYLSWKRLADEQGWEFDETVNHKLRGVARMDSLEIILKHNSLNLPADKKIDLANVKNSYYVDMLNDINDSDILPGAVDFIGKIRQAGMKTALCSSSKNARKVIDTLGITTLFDTVITGNDLENPKPHPEIFQRASNDLGVHPMNCIVFEDAESGIEAALAAQMWSVGIGKRKNLWKAHSVTEYYNEIDIDALIETGLIKRPFLIYPWQITHTDSNPQLFQLAETCLTVSNGFMGIRGALEEDYAENRPGNCVHGFYEKVPRDKYWYDEPDYFQTTANHYDWRYIKLEIDGEEFSLFSGEVLNHSRTLDMHNGILTRSCKWKSPAGKEVLIETSRIVSLNRIHSGAIRYEVTPLNFSGQIKITSEVRFYEPTSLTKDSVLKVLNNSINNNTFISSYNTRISGLNAAFACTHKNSTSQNPICDVHDQWFSYQISQHQDQNKKITLDKHISLFTCLESQGELSEFAYKTAIKDANDGFEILSEEHSRSWQEFWSENDIEIEGNDIDQGAIRFNLFSLRQAHNDHNLYSIPANGLTGDHFMGLVFWDTDVYMQPYYAYNHPVMARHITMYRYNTLQQARIKAGIWKNKGAKFPWTTINGHESSCNPTVGPCQYHINGDVVFGLWRYVTTSGDLHFMHDYGAEILFETARFWSDLGHYTYEGKFEIHFVTGPDEFSYIVNNDFYTNMLAKFNWQLAIATAQDMQTNVPEKYRTLAEKINLTEQELADWDKCIELINMPYNIELGIWEQDEAFLRRKSLDISKLPANYGNLKRDYSMWELGRLKVIKQPSVLLIEQMLWENFDVEQKKRDYDYYLPLTTHGSSLSPAIHSITASEIGYHDEAYKLFRQSILLDLCDFRRNTRNGLHYACIGSCWMSIVNGFAGMRDNGKGLSFAPSLPEQWKSLSFNLRYQGRRLNIKINREYTNFQLLEGDEIEIYCDKSYLKLICG